MQSVQENLFRQLKKKKLIFTITTGRSGTGYLANILNYSNKISSFHEPNPSFSTVLENIHSDSELALDFLINQKLPAILKTKNSIYIETSHLFGKGFLEPLIELNIIPDLIILRRDKTEVAKSLFKLDTIPERTENGRRYCISPQNDVLLKIKNWDKLNDYQLCYWYTLEMEARQQRYKELLSNYNAHIVDINFTELITYDGFMKIINTLNLPKPNFISYRRYKKLKDIKINSKINEKNRNDFPTNLKENEKEVYYILGI